MRRTLFLIAVCVALGATVNVGVAWWIAATAGDRYPKTTGFILPPAEAYPPFRWPEHFENDWLAAETMVIYDHRSWAHHAELLISSEEWHVPEENGGIEFWRKRHVQALHREVGWPMLSLSCSHIGTSTESFFHDTRTDKTAANEDHFRVSAGIAPPPRTISLDPVSYGKVDWLAYRISDYQFEPVPLIPIPLGFAANTAAYAGLSAMTLFGVPAVWRRVFRAQRRAKLGLCVSCGYDVDGLERCPECGRGVDL